MDRDYSVWADMLSKFHTSSEAIQALWLIVVPALVFGVTWCVTRLVRDIVVAALRRRFVMNDLFIYGRIRDEHGSAVEQVGQQQPPFVIPGPRSGARNP
jgi:hypothetical protein